MSFFFVHGKNLLQPLVADSSLKIRGREKVHIKHMSYNFLFITTLWYICEEFGEITISFITAMDHSLDQSVKCGYKDKCRCYNFCDVGPVMINS